MVKTVIFDLGGVFVEVDPHASISRLRGELNGIPRAEILRVIRDPELKKAHETGAIGGYTFYEEIRKRLQGNFSFEFFREVWQGIFRPIQPMIDLLPTLKRRHRLVLLSNTNALHADYLRRIYSFFDLFNVLIFSHEVGLVKPDEAIFRLALARSESQAETCVFIDDCVENVHAAASVGMQSYLFKGSECVQGIETEDDGISVRELLLTD